METTGHDGTRNSFRKIKRRASAAGLASLSLFLLCFTPDRPFGMAPGFPHDQLDRSRAQKIHETFRLYGVLRAAAPRFNHDYAWKLAATVHTESRKHSLDPFLVLAIIRVESAFEEKALSIKGAQGLMQILPFVAEAVAEEAGIRGWNGNRSLDDPFVNIQLGVSYLKTLKTKFKDLAWLWPRIGGGRVRSASALTNKFLYRSSIATKSWSIMSFSATKAPRSQR